MPLLTPAFKPSGVEWLGDIPAHWRLKRLRTIAGIRYGLGQPPRELEVFEAFFWRGLAKHLDIWAAVGHI